MGRQAFTKLVVSAVLLASGFSFAPSSGAHEAVAEDSLVGAWRGKVQFKSGAFAAVKDLEFLYAFNAGGTMTESSSYDAMPPAMPAYGVWKKLKPRQYEAKYVFFWTNPPKALEALTSGGGWTTGGSGVLVEKITLAEDGKSYTSTIKLDVFDQAGKPVDGASEAEAQVARITFDP